MNTSAQLGRLLFAVGIIAFGSQSLICSDFVPGLEPVPVWVSGRLYWADLSGVFLIAAGACIVANKKVRWAAIALGLFLFVWILFLHVPKLVLAPTNGNVWTCMFETLALGGAAWVLAGTTAAGGDCEGRDLISSYGAKFGRICYGISLPVFGILHFIYPEYVASAIPAWIPAHLFWTYFIGVAFCAAGVSIVAPVRARLTASLLGIMFGLWVLILHAPRVYLAYPRDRYEWASLSIALAMSGGAWLIAGSSRKKDRV